MDRTNTSIPTTRSSYARPPDGRTFRVPQRRRQGSRPRSDRRRPFANIKEPLTELVFQAGEKWHVSCADDLHQRKMQHRYSRAPSYGRPPHSCRNSPECIAATKVDMPREVILKDGGLLIHSLKSNDIPLLPVAADLFNGRGNRIRFTRECAGVRSPGALLIPIECATFRLERAQ